ncbi:MAG: efflux RND transporter periplasmic adaptor subunit [Cyclobacteriaceae bacterium]|nr:efflux RND transporter periplasmic adaptor subunit [Cyclobacteriaceae bacterium]
MKYPRYMKTQYLFPIILLIAAACGGSEGDKNLEAKKAELDKARAELQKVKGTITELEKEISALDPEFARQNTKAILVSTFVAEKKPFEHKVEVRGSVESRRNVFLSAQTGGEIKRINVKEGQRVTQGQTLIELDADVIRRSITELKTSLELATTVFEKQSKLWEQKIGTEVQYLQAKNNKESLENKLSTMYAQLNLAMIKAPFTGTVDQLPARVGEMASPGMPLVRVVSTDEMYLKTDVSERFIGRFKAGDKVDILFPLINKTVSTVISSVGQVINEENRTFEVEAKLPNVNFVVKPNQVVILQLLDYVNEDALAVPTRLIQKDEDGQFIYIVDKRESGPVARKIHVVAGISSNKETEIAEGLQGDEQIVDRGFRELTEGVEVMIANNEAVPAGVAKK